MGRVTIRLDGWGDFLLRLPWQSVVLRRVSVPYQAEISRSNPSCFVFLIDQSGSMGEVMDPTNAQAMDKPVNIDGQTYTHTASGPTKAQAVADAINRLLQNLAIKCAKSEGVRDYYSVAVIGYGGDNTAGRVAPAFGGMLAGKDIVPISEIANTPARIEERSKKVSDGAGGLVEQKVKFPIWFEAVSNGGTPMCQAFAQAQSILHNWIQQHPTSFPPIVINITDGESTDGDPTTAAESVKSLATSDGAVLLFNVHISSKRLAPIEFPDSDDVLPDQYAKLLFGVSSILPSYMQQLARQEGIVASEMTRGFVFNAKMEQVIQFLDIGTRPSNLR